MEQATLKDLQTELTRQEDELLAFNTNIIGPAKRAVEDSAQAIEIQRKEHVAVHQAHHDKVNDLEQAHQEANNKRSAMHQIISKIQTIYGNDAIKRVATSAAVIGANAALELEARSQEAGIGDSGDGEGEKD